MTSLRCGPIRVTFSEGEFRVRMTGTGMADDLPSQSNAIESGVTSAEALVNQILVETAAFFGGHEHVEALFGSGSGPRSGAVTEPRVAATASPPG